MTRTAVVHSTACKVLGSAEDPLHASCPPAAATPDCLSMQACAKQMGLTSDTEQCSHDIADSIGQGSPLEMCYYLGKLQEEQYLLSKPPKRKGEVDVMIKVPMLGYACTYITMFRLARKPWLPGASKFGLCNVAAMLCVHLFAWPNSLGTMLPRCVAWNAHTAPASMLHVSLHAERRCLCLCCC